LHGPPAGGALVLSEGVLRSMFVTRLKVVAAVLGIAVLAGAAGLNLRRALAAATAQRPKSAADRGGPRAETSAAGADLHGDPLPAGAVARLGMVRFRHGANINAVA